jgi:hypothetical protein
MATAASSATVRGFVGGRRRTSILAGDWASSTGQLCAASCTAAFWTSDAPEVTVRPFADFSLLLVFLWPKKKETNIQIYTADLASVTLS